MTPHTLEADETLCFIHIPKTAGSTLRGVLDAKFAVGDICPADDYWALKAYDSAALGRFRLLRGHFWHTIGERIGSRAVLMTMLRDPIERTISQYEHWKRDASQHKPQLPGTLSFAEWLEHDIVRADTRDVQTRYFAATGQPAFHWPSTPTTHGGLEVAKANLEACAFVGIAESFDRSMRLLAYTFDWNPTAKFDVRNAAVNRVQRAEIPPAILDRVVDLNRDDQLLYDFGRRLFEERVDRMMTSVLEERHLTRRARRVRPVLAAHVSADLPADGEGWYPPEPDAGGSYFRWTGPEPVSWLDLPLAAGRTYRIRIVLAHWVTPSTRDTLAIHAGPNRIEMQRAAGEPYAIEGTIGPASITAPFTRIQLAVAATCRPIDLGMNGDRRRLGVAVKSIDVTATEN